MAVRETEISIGNILSLSNQQVMVDEIYKGPDGNYVLKLKDKQANNAHWLDHFNGIPLSQEWLQKFGFDAFEDEEGNGNFTKGDKFVIWSYIDDRGKFSYDSFLIDYVHQLQNLYHILTGEELQIKES